MNEVMVVVSDGMKMTLTIELLSRTSLIIGKSTCMSKIWSCMNILHFTTNIQKKFIGTYGSAGCGKWDRGFSNQYHCSCAVASGVSLLNV